MLLALGAAAVSQLPVDLAMRWVLRLHPLFSPRARLAWLAIASSGILMAVGYRGVDGMGSVGIWGPLLFSTPVAGRLVRVRTARLGDARVPADDRSARDGAGVRRHRSARPLATSGRACRAPWPASSGCSTTDTSDLEMAALLHHLGQVTIDEPDDPSRPIPASEVAAVTSTMLREIKPLAAAGDIVAGDAADPRRAWRCRCLRVASDYDDLTARDGNEAARRDRDAAFRARLRLRREGAPRARTDCRPRVSRCSRPVRDPWSRARPGRWRRARTATRRR